MNNIVLLDYDGYIAKSYYAGRNKEEPNNFEECYRCLFNMEGYAIEKAMKFFNCGYEDLKIIRAVSGHTYKKDLYPSYKAKREQDEYLGMYRTDIKERYKNEITLIEYLEADDVLIMVNELFRDDSIVYSDDKDLHKYCKWTCGLNEERVINKDKYGFVAQLVQLASGDSIDNIKGCPNYGEKKTETYLKRNGYDIYNIIKLYKDNDVNIDDCLKNLILTHPVATGILKANIYTQEEIVDSILNHTEIDYSKVFYQIHNVIACLNELVKEVYNEKESNNNKQQ